MTTTTEAMQKMLESGMATIQWGLIALKGAAEENIQALSTAREQASEAVRKASEALSAIDYQLKRSGEILRNQEASLAAIQKAVEIAGGGKQ